MRIKVTPEELFKAKFIETLKAVNGYFLEAKGDKVAGNTYSANAVYGRMEKIKDALENDIKNLSKSVEFDAVLDEQILNRNIQESVNIPQGLSENDYTIGSRSGVKITHEEYSLG